ncbi:MAG: sialidase family protein [Candidatus Binatia bacterium]
MRNVVAALLLLTVPAAARAQVPVFGPPVAVDPAVLTDTHSDELPRIAAGVAGVWVLVWQVVGAGDLGLGRDVDVVYSRSSDDGKNWTAPKPLSERFRSDRAEDRQPIVATDGKGTWMVAWTSTQDLGTSPRRDRDIHFVVSTDNALTWSESRALNSNAGHDWGDDEAPDIATDRNGRWVVAWQSADSLGNTKGGDRDILFATSTDAGNSWSPPEIVDAAARTDVQFDTAPRVAADASGLWLVAWSSGSASQDRGDFQRGVLVARSEDGTATWQPPQSLSGSSEDDRPDWGPRLAGDGRGNWVCAWASSDNLGTTVGHDRDLLYVRSSDNGRTWTTRATLNSEAAHDFGDDDTPELAVDSAGNWVAVWTSWDRRGAARGADADLLMAMSRDNGASWSRSLILNTNAKDDHGEDTTPSLATDGSGLWITAWASTEPLGEVLGRDRDVLIASGRFGFEFTGPPSPDAR